MSETQSINAPITYYRLYAKFPGQKRFMPLDCGRGVPVVNLIYATIFERGEADKVLEAAKRGNPTIEFQLRATQ